MTHRQSSVSTPEGLTIVEAVVNAIGAVRRDFELWQYREPVAGCSRERWDFIAVFGAAVPPADQKAVADRTFDLAMRFPDIALTVVPVSRAKWRRPGSGWTAHIREIAVLVWRQSRRTGSTEQTSIRLDFLEGDG